MKGRDLDVQEEILRDGDHRSGKRDLVAESCCEDESKSWKGREGGWSGGGLTGTSSRNQDL